MQERVTQIPPGGYHAKNENGEIGYPVQLFSVDIHDLFMHMVRWHWHPEIEIMMIRSGVADFFADDVCVRLHMGQGVLINRNVMHSLHLCDENMHCLVYSLKFHASFLFGYGNTTMSNKYLAPVFSSPSLRFVPLLDQDEWHTSLKHLADQIIEENTTCQYGYELTTKSCLCQLWKMLTDKTVPETGHASSVSATTSLDEVRVKDIILFIEEHYRESLTLDDLAGAIHISKSECCRCFKRTLQITPVEYLIKYRIFQAAILLQQGLPGIQTISDLAFYVGFNNASYFNKVFKQYLNSTPSEYRRKVKNNSLLDLPMLGTLPSNSSR